MLVTLAAIGKMKKGPEQELAQRYQKRIQSSGKATGISALKVLEFSESRAASAGERKRMEARDITDRLSATPTIIAFDERRKTPTSRQFAQLVKKEADAGTSELALIIGGPDGLDEAFRNQAKHVISFGALTMPHQIVRILVLEQVYRAVTILTNHPYHRD